MTPSPHLFPAPASPAPGPGAAPAGSAPIPAVSPALPPTSPAETLAVKLVERVGEIADQIAARPAEQLRIELDLPDHTRVEVRLALREGRLHADFRTDSADLRDALSRSWRDFASSPESASARWAEPTFAPASPSTALSPSPSTPAQPPAAQTGLSDRHDHRREPAHDHPARPAPAPDRAPSTTTTSTTATLRTDSSRLLSAVA